MGALQAKPLLWCEAPNTEELDDWIGVGEGR